MAGLLGIAAWAAAAASAPEPDAADVTWHVPQSCPDEAGLWGRLTRLSGAAAVRRGVQASATVTRTHGGFELELVLAAPRSEVRKLHAPDCAVLVDAAAVILAVAADPVAVVEGVPAGRETPSVPEPVVVGRARPRQSLRAVTESVEPPGPAPAVPERPRASVRFGLRPEVGVGVGVLPGAGPGFGGAAAVWGRRWRAELQATHWLSRTHDVAQPEVGGSFSLTTATARGCGLALVSPIELPVCVGLEAGAVLAEGRGAPVTQRRASPWVAVAPAVAVAWAPVRWLALMARIEGVIGLRRPAYHLDAIGPVYTLGVGGARAHAGIELRFP